MHGGHVTEGEDLDDRHRQLAQDRSSAQADSGGFAVPVLIENTAGGDNAMARQFDALARLWDAVGEFDVGFCLDTCHAFAAGEDLVDLVDRVKAITGRIDLVHLNSSRDEFGSARDRHANIASGTIDPELLVAVVARRRRAGRGRDAGARARPPTSRSCASTWPVEGDAGGGGRAGARGRRVAPAAVRPGRARRGRPPVRADAVRRLPEQRPLHRAGVRPVGPQRAGLREAQQGRGLLLRHPVPVDRP